MIKLRPQHLKDSYYAEIEKQLRAYFLAEVIEPIIALVREANKQELKIENATGDAAVRAAIRSGRVQYIGGVFSGKFSAAISSALKKLGAKFDKRSGVFKLPEAQVPQWLAQEAADYFLRAKLAHQLITEELQRTLARVEQSRYHVDAKEMVGKVDKGWRASAAKLEVKPELTSEGKENLASKYSNNLDLYIRKWLKEDIFALRRDVQTNAEAGFRFDSLIKKIQQRKSVSDNKAKFLARQETGLFMSEYRQQRFKEAGVTHYQWSTSHDARVRPAAGLSAAERAHEGNHRVLDGQTFSYSIKAPAAYMSVGQPCNPGQDYNCRCVDIPLLA